MANNYVYQQQVYNYHKVTLTYDDDLHIFQCFTSKFENNVSNIYNINMFETITLILSD